MLRKIINDVFLIQTISYNIYKGMGTTNFYVGMTVETLLGGIKENTEDELVLVETENNVILDDATEIQPRWQLRLYSIHIPTKKETLYAIQNVDNVFEVGDRVIIRTGDRVLMAYEIVNVTAKNITIQDIDQQVTFDNDDVVGKMSQSM